ncbi:MAG TPA: hypothetical protein VFG54_10700 [Prolixibacteraceae bacterium]|nr:hypothetical protein [Prolixibacteraceae bacterium]
MRKLLSISLILIALYGCRDIQCPAFPEKLLAYMPYEKEDLIKFKNFTNDTLTFTVTENWASGPSSFGWNCKCSCISEASYETDINHKHSLKLNGGVNISNDSYLTNIGCVFNDGDSITDQFSLKVTSKNPYSKDNSSFFGDSIVIDKEENERISKVIIVEGKGIVAFFDKKENCTWTKIE